MKYKLEYACGHTTTVDCTIDERDHMRELIGRTYCPDCWAKQTATGKFVELRLSRAEHDANYWSCKIKPSSYDSKTDTVVVNVFNDLLAERTKIAELVAQSVTIEGMDELRAIRKVRSDYRAAFNHWREDGCEGNPPAAPAVAITDIAAKYPRAAAFVEAEDFSRGADDTVCTMCRKAMEKILRGEDYTKAIEEMHREWNNWNPLEEARKWILAEGQKKSAGGTE